MLVDWFTVIAQAVNFLILVWLLKRFLYRPVLDAIDAREKHVADQLRDADDRKAQAQKERDEFQLKNETFDRERETLHKQAVDEAKEERRRLVEQARQEAEALRARLQDTVRSESDSLGREITSRTQQEVFAIARKALADLAGVSLEERMAAAFIQRLRALDPAEKAKLTSYLSASHRPALVCSAFDLPAKERTAIESAIHEALQTQGEVRFETAPSLVSGIELTTNGHKVAWSIAEYLTSLEKIVDASLDTNHANER